jgi:hypothetical protein
MVKEDESGNIMMIGRMIHIRDDATILRYSVRRSKQMGLMGLNWPCTSFLSGQRGQTPALSITTQHDEIIVEATDAIEDQVKVIVKESMEEALERVIPEVTFIAEIRVAESWKS